MIVLVSKNVYVTVANNSLCKNTWKSKNNGVDARSLNVGGFVGNLVPDIGMTALLFNIKNNHFATNFELKSETN